MNLDRYLRSSRRRSHLSSYCSMPRWVHRLHPQASLTVHRVLLCRAALRFVPFLQGLRHLPRSQRRSVRRHPPLERWPRQRIRPPRVVPNFHSPARWWTGVRGAVGPEHPQGPRYQPRSWCLPRSWNQWTLKTRYLRWSRWGTTNSQSRPLQHQSVHCRC